MVVRLRSHAVAKARPELNAPFDPATFVPPDLDLPATPAGDALAALLAGDGDAAARLAATSGPDVVETQGDALVILERARLGGGLGPAVDALADHADPVVRELAGLYAVAAAPRGPQGGPVAEEAAIVLLEEAETPWIRAEASRRLVAVRHGVGWPDGSALAVVEAAMADAPDAPTWHALARYGLRDAMASGRDPERWLEEVEQSAVNLDTDDRGHFPVPVSAFGLAALAGEVRAARRGATTWQGAFTAAVWRCHHAGEGLAADRLSGRAEWNGGWAWRGFRPSRDAMAACVERETRDAPAPTSPVIAALSVWGRSASDTGAW